jgi:outer membrane protein OmpA-like peptidoglycan-associated protein
MRLDPRALLLTVLAGCAATENVPPAPASAPAPAPAGGDVLRGAELARVRCLVIAPLENATDDAHAAEAATAALLAGIDASRVRAMPVSELRALFRDTAFELPEGIGPGLALELGQLLGADGVLYGAVEGRAASPDASLIVTVRVATPEDRNLLYAVAATVDRRPDEDVAAAVRRVTAAAAQPMLKRLGTPGRKSCFDRERQARLRALALSDARAAQAPPQAPATARPPPAAAPAAAPPPAATPPPVTPSKPAAAPAPAAPKAAPARTPRQADWAKRLARRQRLVVEDVAFKGRSATLEGEAGLADLAAAVLATSGLKIRIEGFVDATSDPGGDARLSMSMAQAAGQRLVELGVPRGRVTWAGRGGESPLLPNFTARGRAANRRLEAVGLR